MHAFDVRWIRTESTVASPLIDEHKDLIISGDDTPAATHDMLRKDVGLLLSAAQQHGIGLPVTSATKNICDAVFPRGLGQQDFSVLIPDAAAIPLP